MASNKWTLQIEMDVNDAWVEDGFDVSERLEEIREMLSELLPFAVGDEFIIKTKIIKSPNQEIIKRLQGYKILEDEFQVRDALGGSVSGDYKKDLKYLMDEERWCDEKTYDEAYQNTMMP